MKYLLCVVLCTLPFQTVLAAPKELPKRPYQKKIEFSQIGYGTDIVIEGRVTVPVQQSAKSSGPTGITIYEQNSKGWIPTSKLQFSIGSNKKTLSIREQVKISDAKGAVAVHLTVVHCHETGKGLCVIDHFQGVVSRDPNSKTAKISFDLVATDPKTFR